MLDPNGIMVCAIYTETDTGEERSDLVGAIARLLSGKVDPKIHYSVMVPRSASAASSERASTYLSVDVLKNPDFNAQLRSEFPHGFLHFRYRVELYTETDKPDSEVKQIVERILNYLWSMKYPAVAACDFEEELPHTGGYKSPLVPWPSATTPHQSRF